jgi:hypothetical protein
MQERPVTRTTTIVRETSVAADRQAGGSSGAGDDIAQTIIEQAIASLNQTYY